MICRHTLVSDRGTFSRPLEEDRSGRSGTYLSSSSVKYVGAISLRTFARNFSNIDFFLKILPLKDDELVMSEM